jgi:hypothetical protein
MNLLIRKCNLRMVNSLRCLQINFDDLKFKLLLIKKLKDI